jgi:exonuclease 3'-5' domain-containing protein 1
MSAPPKDVCVKVIDTQLSLHSMLDRIAILPTNPPSLFCALEEETNLGRDGSTFTVWIYAVPTNTAYLVDVQLLDVGDELAPRIDEPEVSLKALFKSSAVPKVFFDIRKCSRLFFDLYRINMGGVRDVQLMELGCRPGPLSDKRYLFTLADCVATYSASSDVQKERQRAEQDITRLFDTREQEAADIVDNRLIEMDAQQQRRSRDLLILPSLHGRYDKKLRRPNRKFWQAQVQRATEDRTKLSQAPRYGGGQANNSTTLGPWSESDIQQAVEAWDEDVMFDLMHGEEEDEDGNERLLEDLANRY